MKRRNKHLRRRAGAATLAAVIVPAALAFRPLTIEAGEIYTERYLPDELYRARAAVITDAGIPHITAREAIITLPETEPPAWEPEAEDIAILAKTIYGEAGIVASRARQAAVGWCILNRVDSEGFADTIREVVTAPHQFAGYRADCEPPEEFIELARDVLIRHHREAEGEENVGRTLPKNYMWFTGNGKENTFTDKWKDGRKWDWSLPSPYEEE